MTNYAPSLALLLTAIVVSVVFGLLQQYGSKSRWYQTTLRAMLWASYAILGAAFLLNFFIRVGTDGRESYGIVEQWLFGRSIWTVARSVVGR